MQPKWGKRLIWFLILISSAAAGLAGLVYFLTWHPKPIEAMPIFRAGTAPRLMSGQSLKLMSYNVQYMAGKGYVFFYDLPGDSGPDIRPTSESITATLEDVARTIKAEQPDIILLQEVNDGAKRTDYEDQLERLLPLLPSVYSQHTSAYYWKNRFVPHRYIMGATGMKLVTLSRYEISSAIRYQLPLRNNDILRRQFNFKRAILEVKLPIGDSNREFVIFNTHLDAFAHNTDTMKRQVGKVDEILSDADNQGGWIIGGDFNLLPPGHTWDGPRPADSSHRSGQTDIAPLYEKYGAFPSLSDVSSASYKDFYTQFPNNPAYTAPNKTIDYFFFPEGTTVDTAYVRQHDTWQISDHLPLLISIRIP